MKGCSAAAGFDSSEFPHFSKIEDPPNSFADRCRAFAVPGCLEQL